MTEQKELFPKGGSQEAVTLKIKVGLDPVFLISKRGGEPYCKIQAANVDKDNAFVQVLAFGEAAHKVKDLKKGAVITVTGKWDEKESTKFIMWAIYEPKKPGQKSASFLLHMAREFGSVGAYRADRDARFKAQEDSGYVPLCRHTQEKRIVALSWDSKENCVYHEGRWIKKIDYLIEMMGASAVMAEVKLITRSEINYNQPAQRDKKGKKVPTKALYVPWAKQFREWVNDKADFYRFNQGELFP